MARVKQCGVYILTHVQSGQFYIGSTNDLHSRNWTHRNAMKHGRHRNPGAQALYNVDPEFRFTSIPYLTREECYEVEQEMLDAQKGNPLLLNRAKDARNPGEFTQEAREKIKATRAANGYVHSAETREKLSKSRRARVTTEETKAKMRGPRGPHKNPRKPKVIS
ncbi:GIY-YIG endonuclease [Pseudomonas phage hairong]|nr:GIY-YIG endonuclease [Pseudomonas phage hairong]